MGSIQTVCLFIWLMEHETQDKSNSAKNEMKRKKISSENNQLINCYYTCCCCCYYIATSIAIWYHALMVLRLFLSFFVAVHLISLCHVCRTLSEKRIMYTFSSFTMFLFVRCRCLWKRRQHFWTIQISWRYSCRLMVLFVCTT